MKWINCLKFCGGRTFGLRALAAVVVFAAVSWAVSAFGDCSQTSASAFYISSWDSYGILNTVRIEENRYPDRFAGKGPYGDRHDPGRLMRSYHVFGFEVPLLSGPVASAALRLQIRYLNSFRWSQDYQC